MNQEQRENREKIAEWIRDPEMEAIHYNKWYNYEEALESRIIYKIMENIETRKRKSKIDGFMEEIIPYLVGWQKENIKELAIKHFGDKQ